MGEPKRNPVLGEIFARARQKPKRNLMWEWLKGIHIPRRVWGGLLLLFGSVLAGWLIRIGYTQNWTGWKNKTLWDWMGLLVVPLSLALVAYLFSRQERKTDRAIAAEQHQQRLLQDYLDRISKLLLDEAADELQPESRIAVVAQALTLTVLRQSDAVRRTVILRFLNEAKLIQSGRKIVDLNGAELSEAALPGVNLEEVDLSGAILEKCDLRNSILRKAHLDRAILSGSKLDHADLRGAHLNGAKLIRCHLDHTNLSEAHLSGAELIRCNLTEAWLSGAVLEGTDLTGSDLSKAHLQGAYFGGAILDRAILNKVHYNNKTRGLENFPLPPDAINISAYWRDRAAQKMENQASHTEGWAGGEPSAGGPPA